jgi:hypothetical protein
MTETHFQCECCAEDWAATWMNLPFNLIGSCIIRSPLGFGGGVCDTCDNQARVLILLRNTHQTDSQ